MANSYLTHTLAAAGTNGNKKATFSAWLKRATPGAEHVFYNVRQDGSNFIRFRFNSDQINVTSNTSGTNYYATTRELYRDPAAFYHVVVTYDTTQGTAANRIRIYVNGQEQIKSASNYPSQDATLFMIASGSAQVVGHETSNGAGYFDGLMAHVHYTEGYAYAATDFGETDTTSGIWVPKFSPSVTYGTNGFFLKFENSGAMGTDSSGQSNTFTPAGNLKQNIDTPTNNLVTLNSINPGSSITYSNGNTTFTNGASGHRSVLSTFAVSTGKWYAEVKIGSLGGAYPTFGIFDSGDTNFNPGTFFTATASGYGYNSNGAIYHNNSEAATGYATWTTGDIIGLALDATNNKIYVSKNGTFQNSANPATGTNGFSITADKTWYFAGHSNDGGTDPVQNFNFGAGFFGTTAVASANADANGHGAFEYAVPSGYYTLNTKNLKEFG